ncbi:MAG: hypothetical protein Q9162_002105 [Coniocarpon cinnabarinum]
MADISDIIASVTRGQLGSSAQDEEQQRQHDLQLLTRAWVAERTAPELLPYPTKLMERIMGRIRAQVYSRVQQHCKQKIEHIEDATARMDAGSSFGLIIIQTELERFKFLVRSLLRSRISKIDAHTLHILSQHDPSYRTDSQTQREEPQDREKPLLSESEARYAATHTALLERHYSSLFLSSFPPKLRRMDDRAGAGGVGMVEGPDLNAAVFVRCLGRWQGKSGTRRPQRSYELNDEDEDMNGVDSNNLYEPVEVSCGHTGRTEEQDDSLSGGPRIYTEERRETMHRGDIWIVRWSSVREAVSRGECELI